MRRAAAAVLAVLLVLSLWIPALAEKPEEVLAETLASLQRAAGQDSLQGWVDESLSESVSGNGGWYLMALDRGGYAVNGDRCRERMAEAAGQEIGSITKKLRMSLTMLCLGMDRSFPERTLQEAAGQDSLMALIFACHLSMNGVPGGEAVPDRILAMQKADGGWAIMGDSADPDCTAMALQALAPLYGKDGAVKAAADRGLEALSRIQTENGGYSGMGLESAESSAQVILALCSLGIDPGEDKRFIKNGKSVPDALLSFRRADGGFAHGPEDEKSNETATLQACLALAACKRLKAGGGPFYLFEQREEAALSPIKNTAAQSAGGALPRGPLYLVIGGLTAIACLVSLIRKKRSWRTYAFILAVGALAAGAVALTEIRTPESYYAAGARRAEDSIETRISIRCDTVAGRNQWAPADGVILEETPVLIGEGGTAFDQLLEATRLNHIQMEYDGTAEGAYIRGIGYLYEYNFGNLSGWMFRVNGMMADVGASRYTLKAGDLVEWVYTTDIGRDVN